MRETPSKKSKKPKLHALRPRDITRIKAGSAGYTRLVETLRWLLPTTVIVALGSLVFWPRWSDNAISLTTVDNIPNLMVEKLNLNGLDSKNQPYTVTAERALQAATERNIINLHKPKGELTLSNGGWVTGQANQGRLDQNTNFLTLNGSAEIFHDKGYRFASDEMSVDIAKGSAWGSQPVVIQGSFGEIHGSGFQLFESGKVIIVKGRAEAKLYLQGARSSDKPNLNHSPSR